MTDHDYRPPDHHSPTGHLGSYRRRLPVSLERMYENTIDWEHLPYLHASSFKQIDCLDAGAWGWRARLTDHKDQVNELELRLDRSRRRWITRTVAGPNTGAEIWTQVAPLAAHEIEIVVDFYVPDVPEAAREKLGRAYAAGYERLYDEDESMMVTRQRHLDQRVRTATDEPDAISLGAIADVPPRQVLAYRGKQWVIVRSGEQWRVFPALCPHQLARLDECEVVADSITCPWHGYRFDLASGANLSGQSCELTGRPTASERDGELWLHAPQQAAAG